MLQLLNLTGWRITDWRYTLYNYALCFYIMMIKKTPLLCSILGLIFWSLVNLLQANICLCRKAEERCKFLTHHQDRSITSLFLHYPLLSKHPLLFSARQPYLLGCSPSLEVSPMTHMQHPTTLFSFKSHVKICLFHKEWTWTWSW